MKALNKETAKKTVRPERIIQFGEGNFLRAFVDWIIYNMNEKADFNSSVVVVQPIDKGMIDMLNAQDCLYHVNLQGLDKGETVNSLTMIDVISRALNPYSQFEEFMKLAEQPEMRFVISNTTEAGIAFDPSCKLEDAPASSYPGKLTQLLYHRYKTFHAPVVVAAAPVPAPAKKPVSPRAKKFDGISARYGFDVQDGAVFLPFKYLPIPEMVPPVPTPATRKSTFPTSSSSISSFLTATVPSNFLFLMV